MDVDIDIEIYTDCLNYRVFLELTILTNDMFLSLVCIAVVQIGLFIILLA